MPYVVVGHRSQDILRRTTEHGVPVSHEFGPRDSRQDTIHKPSVRPCRMNRAKVSQKQVVDIDAPKAQTSCGTPVQCPMKGNQSRPALRVHLPGSDGNHVEVADAPNVVTGSRRSTDEQLAHPPEAQKLFAQRCNTRRQIPHPIILAPDLSRCVRSRIPWRAGPHPCSRQWGRASLPPDMVASIVLEADTPDEAKSLIAYIASTEPDTTPEHEQAGERIYAIFDTTSARRVDGCDCLRRAGAPHSKP
jgi:hypothetical protein